MSQGTMCLTCRKYITTAEWGCRCEKPIASDDGKTPIDIGALKARLRAAVLTYRRTLGADLDCGGAMAAVIRPGVGAAAQKANEIARKLKAIDPEFPATWTPFPEG